jgi:hypothetical protein
MTTIESSSHVILRREAPFTLGEDQLAAGAFLVRYSGRTLEAYRHDLRPCCNGPPITNSPCSKPPVPTWSCTGRQEGPILVRQDGRRLDRRTAHRWVTSMGKRAGLGSVHPHAPGGFHHGGP